MNPEQKETKIVCPVCRKVCKNYHGFKSHLSSGTLWKEHKEYRAKYHYIPRITDDSPLYDITQPIDKEV